MTPRRASALVLAVLVLGPTYSDKIRAQTPDTSGIQFLRQLDSLRRTNPQEYASFRTLFVTAAQMGLGQLGFGPITFSGVVDSSTVASVRRFERARHLVITGDPFTRATFQRLNADIDRVQKAEHRPSLGFKAFTWDSTWVIAEGPWYMEGEVDDYMVVHVYCDRTGGECRLAWARIGPMPLTGRTLQILTETFQVGRWDDSEVISEPLDYPCTRYLLRINRLQETVVMTRSTLSKGDLCQAMNVGDLVTRLIRPEDWPASGSLDSSRWGLYNLGPAARSALQPKPR